MKNIFKIVFAAIVGFLLISCEKDEDRAVLGNPSPSALTASATTFVLLKDDAAKDAVKFSWQAPSFGNNIVINNVLQFAVKGTNFAKPKEVILGAGTTSVSFKVQDFNGILLGAGAPIGSQSQVEVRLKSTTESSAVAPVYSSAIPLTVTPYALISYVYAPGAYQGWNPATATALVSENSNGIYTGYINFPTDGLEFKITPNRSWDGAYGSDNGSTLSTSAGNIKAPGVGSYKLVVDLNKSIIAMTPFRFGIVGSATPNGWATPDTKMTLNSTTGIWEATLALTAGEMKFRANDAWDINYGGSGGNAVAGGDNIQISAAGIYNVTLDTNNMKYTLVKQ